MLICDWLGGTVSSSPSERKCPAEDWGIAVYIKLM